MTARCRDCMRRAVPDSPYCDECLRAHLAAAFAASTPVWRRRGMEGLNRPKDLSGANR
jgi:hypothetical protein